MASLKNIKEVYLTDYISNIYVFPKDLNYSKQFNIEEYVEITIKKSEENFRDDTNILYFRIHASVCSGMGIEELLNFLCFYNVNHITSDIIIELGDNDNCYLLKHAKAWSTHMIHYANKVYYTIDLASVYYKFENVKEVFSMIYKNSEEIENYYESIF